MQDRTGSASIHGSIVSWCSPQRCQAWCPSSCWWECMFLYSWRDFMSILWLSLMHLYRTWTSTNPISAVLLCEFFLLSRLNFVLRNLNSNVADLSENVPFSWQSVLFNGLGNFYLSKFRIQGKVNGWRHVNPAVHTEGLLGVKLRPNFCLNNIL